MNDYRYSLLTDDYKDATKIDDAFLTNMYIYFRHGGYYNIIMDDTVNILISIFMMLFIKFVYSCVNFHDMFHNTGDHHINEFILWDKFGSFDAFMFISFFIFMIYTSFRIMKTSQNIKNFRKVKNFYNNTLKIKDSNIRNLKWETIIEKLVAQCHSTSTTNVYTVTSRIMKMDNIFISLFDKKQLPFDYLNGLVEWNIRHCFLNSLQEKPNQITYSTMNNEVNNTENYKAIVKKRILIVGVINLLFLPFILLFVAFYTIIQYGEEFYNSPQLITSRTWTRTSKWRFRFYNELPHIFETRMANASIEMKEYFEQFNNRILQIISRFIVFVFSSIFLLLLFIVFINENNLTNTGMFGFQILFYITICATILAIFRNFTKQKLSVYPVDSLSKANEHLKLISDNNLISAGSSKVKNKMGIYYQYHLICLVKEVLSIVITPFYYMPKLYDKSDDICEFILEHIDSHRIMGNVSTFSIFTNYTPDIINRNPKLKYSIESFQENHTEWSLSAFDMAHTINEDERMDLPNNSIHETIVSIADESDE